MEIEDHKILKYDVNDDEVTIDSLREVAVFRRVSSNILIENRPHGK